MTVITVRIGTVGDYSRVQAAYDEWGYQGGVLPQDVLFIAEQGSELVGAVRRAQEHGVTMLRGMQVAPAWQRQGIGRRLLRAFVRDLPGERCYCIPFAHLRAFYGEVGFTPMSEAEAPAFLQERLASYRARGLNVIVMERAAAAST